MLVELDLDVSLKIELQEGEIIDPTKLVSSEGESSVQLGGWSGLTPVIFFNDTEQGHFDFIYIVGDGLSFEEIKPQLLQYANDNYSQMTYIEVEIEGNYYPLVVGKSTEDLKEEIRAALAQENWGKVAELATNMI